MKLIDVSVELKPETIVWPGDRKVTITRQKDMGKGDTYNLSYIQMSLHAGTHVDAPRHFFKRGLAADQLPLDAVVGKARVIYIGVPKVIEPKDLKKHAVKKGERLLIKTVNSSRSSKNGKFKKDFVHLSEDAARYLAQKKLRCLGMDSPSPGSYGVPMTVHRILMNAGIWIIENLDLSKAAPGPYELLCLPLKIVGTEGAPVRAVLTARKN